MTSAEPIYLSVLYECDGCQRTFEPKSIAKIMIPLSPGREVRVNICKKCLLDLAAPLQQS